MLNHRIFRYLISGGLSFAIENLLFSLFFYSIGFNAALANVGSVVLALIFNFIASKFFVFRDSSKGMNFFKQFSTYIVVIMINLAVSTYVIATLVNYGVQGYIAKFCVTVLVVSWTYVLYKRVVFKHIDTH